MLPRRKYFRALVSLCAVFSCLLGITSFPAQAISQLVPEVSVQSLSPQNTVSSQLVDGSTRTVLLAAQTTKTFSLLGVTWSGVFPESTYFQVRTRSNNIWSNWERLNYSDDHGVDPNSPESDGVRFGVDPLLVTAADGVEWIMRNPNGQMPSDLRLDLVNSPVTSADRKLAVRRTVSAQVASTVTSPQGAVVSRPEIVSRSQWGADESKRDKTPRMGTKLIAGFIHHTATTSNYTAEQAPGQIRNLYAYFTQSLKYADMGYNFLVDKYGTIYEGRAGCVRGSSAICDGPSLPVQGAHTAGMNEDTFAVSAVGNFDTVKPTKASAAIMVESISQLLAWKLAPYGLDPNATAQIPSTDDSGKSRYSYGQIASTPVISAHQDVGLTVCPGRYLFPYIPEIKNRASYSLRPVLQDLSVSPGLVDGDLVNQITISAVVPANASWSVDVLNNSDGSLVSAATGTQGATGRVSYLWDLHNIDGEHVAPGQYSVIVGATVNDEVLASATKGVVVARKPSKVSKISFKKIDKWHTEVSWTSGLADVLPANSFQIRSSKDRGKTWTSWSDSGSKTSFIAKRWKRKQGYLVEIIAMNQLGQSKPARLGYFVR